MKRKKISLLFATLGVLAFLVSCNDNNNDGPQYQDIVTVVPTSSGGLSFRQDDGATLLPNNSSETAKNSRAYIQYSNVADSSVGYDKVIKLYFMNYILTKNVLALTASNADSIGNDLANERDIWVGDGYLNVEFDYLAANTGTMHYINLVNNTLDDSVYTDGAIHLEFRHNANKDYTNYVARGFVAFDLRPYQVVDQDSVNLVIKFNEAGGVKEFPVTYKYVNGATSNHKVSSFSDLTTCK